MDYNCGSAYDTHIFLFVISLYDCISKPRLYQLTQSLLAQLPYAGLYLTRYLKEVGVASTLLRAYQSHETIIHTTTYHQQ